MLRQTNEKELACQKCESIFKNDVRPSFLTSHTDWWNRKEKQTRPNRSRSQEGWFHHRQLVLMVISPARPAECRAIPVEHRPGREVCRANPEVHHPTPVEHCAIRAGPRPDPEARPPIPEGHHRGHAAAAAGSEAARREPPGTAERAVEFPAGTVSQAAGPERAGVA